MLSMKYVLALLVEYSEYTSVFILVTLTMSLIQWPIVPGLAHLIGFCSMYCCLFKI